MTPTAVQNHILIALIAFILSCAAGMGAAQDIQTISHGARVDITGSLAPGKLTVVDFYADWCGPCRSIAPKLDRLATANPDDLAIRKVDIINWDSAVAAQYRLQSIPHLKLFDRDGRLLAEGNAGHVMRVLNNHLGGNDIGAEGGRSLTPIFILGGLVSLAIFLLLRGRSSPKSPGPQTTPVHRSDERTASGWFVMMQNSLEGPFAEEDLEEMLRHRRIPGNAKVRRRGQSTWTTVEEVIEHLM